MDDPAEHRNWFCLWQPTFRRAMVSHIRVQSTEEANGNEYVEELRMPATKSTVPFASLMHLCCRQFDHTYWSRL